MKEIYQLVKKDFTIDWKQQNFITAVLLYLSASTFISFIAFKGILTLEAWNALFWVILLFTAVNAISKSFLQESKRLHYYFYTCSPSSIIIAKLIHSFLYLSVVAILSLFVFTLLFGNPIQVYGLFLLNTLLGVLGISSIFTMVSALAFRANNYQILMAVLGFPLCLPIIILSVDNSNSILNGFQWIHLKGNIFSLLSGDVIIIALSYILFPFTWKG